MKLLNVTDCLLAYPGYRSSLERRYPELAAKDYAEQHSVIDRDHLVWANASCQSMGVFGYEVLNVDRSLASIQYAWASERGIDPTKTTPNDLVLKQALEFKPEVVVYDAEDRALLVRLREEVKTLRLVIGRAGSRLSPGRCWELMDVLITCAPESVEALESLGVRAKHIHHGFDHRILEDLSDSRRRIRVSAVGSIVRRSGFHLEREQVLEEVSRSLPLEIYSPAAETGARDWMKSIAAGITYGGLWGLKRGGIYPLVKDVPLVAQLQRVASPLRAPTNARLAKLCRPPVFGLEYFQILRDSVVSLNTHADTSPRFASNLRLFEATGVGSCLLTDWKDNIRELFEPDCEIVTYRTAKEAAAKAQWLDENPDEAQKIGLAAMRRTATAHGYLHRAAELHDLILGELR